MKIAILSDSHDNIPNLEKALDWINQEGIKIIIHCGDLGAPSILTKVMIPKFSGKIHLVYGNVDDPELLEKEVKNFENIKVHGEVGEIELAANTKHSVSRIAFTHQPEKAKELAQSGKYDIVFYGHTHKPWLQQVQINIDQNADRRGYDLGVNQLRNQRKSAMLVNPGTLAGMFYKATFAVYDTETNKLELKLLELL